MLEVETLTNFLHITHTPQDHQTELLKKIPQESLG